ncbi:hypothetical protein CANARDRAFT_28856 [[Candida] arabinofermentans NRRL YB-2248]|uniref:Uncharacterized protein n=1 Tax=[Candida] arabinofermentans NRRL YB-2248 TaxID=983967 RepID=A0A1E4SZ17_9ASCO|nr:hypothetical protein CANARDRAFT_28856 [[Candida] arabinofermentans NRRL YB-2248]
MDIHRCRFVDYTPETITSSCFSHQSNDLTKLTPKNLRLAVGRSDGTIEIFNPCNSTSKWLLETTINGGAGQSVEGLLWALQEDQESTPRLFSIGGSTYLTEWDLKTGFPTANQDCNAGVIWSFGINHSQSKIAVGCDDGSVVVIDIAGGKGVMEHETILQRQQSRVLSICWVGDDMIVGGCADGRIRCWNYSGEGKGRLIQTLRVDKAKTESTLIWSLVAIPTLGQLVSGDSTGSVKFWDLKNFVLYQSFTVHDADVLCLTVDATGTKVFTAGVDRNIYNFNLMKSGKNSRKWVNSSNRLLHANDVRTMCSYQSKNLDLLVSGGVSRIVTINSVENFQASVTNKLPVNPMHKNIIINEAKRLLIMWQGQQVKIWRLNQDQSKKLVCKLTLNDPENITSVAISQSGRYLAVSRPSTSKLFELIDADHGSKLQVVKVPSELFATLGARFVKFADDLNLILMVNFENEVYSVEFNVNDDEESEDDLSEFDDSQQPTQYEMSETTSKLNTFEHLHNYTNLEVSSDGKLSVLSKLDGTIEVLNLETKEATKILKLNEIPTALAFTSKGTIIVTTFDHKLFEFNISFSSSTTDEVSLQTTWSKTNSPNLPQQFITLSGQPYGIFENQGRFWVYGSNWVSFFDSNTNLTPISQQHQSTPQGKKRTRNGSASNGSDTTRKVKETLELSNGASNDKCYWFTNNYKSLLFVNKLSVDELVVVERPVDEMPSSPAFKLSKINV